VIPVIVLLLQKLERETKKRDKESFNLNELNELIGKEQFQFKTSSRFWVLKSWMLMMMLVLTELVKLLEII
jgi:hypothetical protein